jgi:F-type H+-transporting ATPase subunit alpha
VDKVITFETNFYRFMEANHPEIGGSIAREKEISPEAEEKLKAAISEFKKGMVF